MEPGAHLKALEPWAQAVELKEHLAEVRELGELVEPGGHLKALEPCAQAVELKEHLAAVEVREPGELMELGAHLKALEPCAQEVEPKELGGHGDQEALEVLAQELWAQVVEPK